MHQRWRMFSVAMALGLILAACGPGQTGSPSTTDGGASEPPESQAAFEPMAYPEDGPAECGAENNPTNISV